MTLTAIYDIATARGIIAAGSEFDPAKYELTDADVAQLKAATYPLVRVFTAPVTAPGAATAALTAAPTPAPTAKAKGK